MEAILYHRQIGELVTTAKQTIVDEKYHYGVQTSYKGELVSDIVAEGYRSASILGRSEFGKHRAMYSETDVTLVAKDKGEKKPASVLTLEQKMAARLERAAAKIAEKEAEKAAKKEFLAKLLAEAEAARTPLPTVGRGKKKVFSVAQGEVIEA